MVWPSDSPEHTIIKTIDTLSISVQREYSIVSENLPTTQVCRVLGVDFPNYNSQAKVSVSKRKGNLGIFKTTIQLPSEEVELAFNRVADHGSLIAQYPIDGSDLKFGSSGKNIIHLASSANNQYQQFTCIKETDRIDVLVSELPDFETNELGLVFSRLKYDEELLYGVLNQIFK